MADVITIGGVNRSANVHWDSLKIEQVAGEYTAVCSLRLNDPNAAIAIDEKDAITIVDGADTLFAGEAADVDWELLSLGLDGRRIVLACQDHGILVEEAVIDTEEAYSAQADSAIIDDLFSTYRPDIDSTTYVVTLDASMDLTVENVTLRQALVELCKRTGGRWYVDEGKALHYFAAEANVAAWFLSDTPDLANSFPYQSIARRSSGGTIVNQVLVIGTGVSGWREDAGSILDYGERPAVVVDTSITTAGDLQDRGDAILAKWSEPRVTYQVTTRKTGLRAGMDVRLVCGAWTIDETLTVRRLTVRWKGDERFYDLELGDLVVNALEGGRTFGDRLDQIAGDTTDLGETVFDDDPPSAPGFNAGNLSTGTTINNDGTELVWIVTTWGLVGDGDLSHYEVQLSTAADFSANVLTRHHPGDGQRIERWEGLTGNVTYYCRVRAVDWALNASAWVSANIVSATDASAPAQVTGAVAAGARTLIGLTWSASAAADLAYYEVQRSPDGSSGWTTKASIRTTHWIDQSFTEAQVLATTTFYYRVRAVDTSGNPGTWSSTVNAALNPLGSDSIAANAIIAVKIAANAVETDKLDALAVTTAKLDAGAVTVEKLNVVVGGYNLLINSGINDDDDGDGVPDEWTEGTNITNHTNDLSATYRVVGASSFHVEVSAGDVSGDYHFIQQTITLANVPLAADDRFALSGYIQAGLDCLRTTIYVQWWDITPALISSDSVGWVTSDESWTRHTVTGTVPATAVTAKVFCEIQLTEDDGTGHVWFDAIKLERGDVPTSWTTGMIGNVTIDSNRVQVQDANAKVWIGKRGSALGMWGEDAAGNLEVGWYASGANAGAIVAGAGNVLLNTDGISIAAPLSTFYQDDTTIKWMYSGAKVSRVAVRRDSVNPFNYMGIYVEEESSRHSWLDIAANAPSGQDAIVQILANGAGSTGSGIIIENGPTYGYSVRIANINTVFHTYDIEVTGDLTLTGGMAGDLDLNSNMILNSEMRGGYYRRTSAQSIPENTWTKVAYGTVKYQTSGNDCAGSNIYAREAGYYTMQAGYTFASSGDGYRKMRFAWRDVSAATTYYSSAFHAGPNATDDHGSGGCFGPVYMDDGDYAWVEVYQNGEAAGLNVVACTATVDHNWFSMHRVA